jgi:hypothetical protein
VRPSGAAGWRGGGAGLTVLVPPLLALALAQPVWAQAVAAGRVVRPGASDTSAVPGVRVVLHRVGSDRQGPVDSTVSGAGGRFRFRFTADSGVIYLLSARYHGIEYFSPPLPARPAAPDTGLALLVHDTSSTAPVGLAARHLVIPRPDDGGGREVLDLIVLRNEGHLARVAPDSLSDSWSLPLPPGSDGLEVGESDVSSEAVTRRGDSLYLAAPIGPGEKQLSVQYHLPGAMRVVAVPVGASGGAVNVLVEEAGASVRGPGLAAADSQVVLGRNFRRWTGEVPAGGLIRVQLPGPGGGPPWLLPALVSGLALALAVAALWQRRRSAPAIVAPGPPAPVREELLHRIAALDATYQGREADVPAAEWSGYLAERARLKRELEATLAAGRARE